MNAAAMLEMALADNGLSAAAGAQPNTPGCVQVVALGQHKVDGVLVTTGQFYWLEEARAKAAAERDIVHIIHATTLDWWGASGRVLSPWADDPEYVHTRFESAGALRIAQGCGYDPGSAAYRFHSAINACTKHASAFTRFEDTNPHCSLRQFDGVRDAPLVRESLLTADVLHCHMNYLLAANSGSRLLKAGDPRSARPVNWRQGQWIVRHYHGSRPDGKTNLEHKVDDLVRARTAMDGGGFIRVGARLTLCAEPGADDLQWLPITVPVQRYRALRTNDEPRSPNGVFRIAHSPTKRSYKGTEKFTAAVDTLYRKGLPVKAVMIENKSHGDALKLKATCHATFDSFWLGLQGSGLEAGAMGMPCVAGDSDVRALYERHVGHCPYTFAGDQAQLTKVIERLATDPAYYEAETKRVSEYVSAYHDYPAVALRYEQILSSAMNRPDILTSFKRPRRTVAA